MSGRLNKYRTGITYAILLFVVFDAIALAANVWLTQGVQSKTIELNLAGRQRMLSQKMVKEFLQTPPESVNLANLNQLAQTAHLFERTLIAFREGGETLDTSNQVVTIRSLKARPYYYLVEESWALWETIRTPLFAYSETPSVKHFLQLNDTLVDKNLAMLSYMNSLALAIEKQARHEADQISVFQATALIGGMINFAIAFWFYRRRVDCLENQNNLINTLLNKMPYAMAYSDGQDRLIQANPKFLEILEGSQETLSHTIITQLIVPHPQYPGFFTISFADQPEKVLKVERSSAIEKDQHLSIWLVEDISDSHQAQEQLASIAFRDRLTGLENRIAFEKRLLYANDHTTHTCLSAVMFIDLDGFKRVNDLYGHSKGDEVLRQVGLNLSAFCPSNCHIARHGGDEFTVLATHLTNKEQAIKLAKNALTAIAAGPFTGVSEDTRVGASIGVVLFSMPQSNVLSLIDEADSAMYRAKQFAATATKLYLVERASSDENV